jgi:amylosucrase
MDWDAAGRRHDPSTVEGRLWAGLRALAATRRSTRAVHAQGRVEPLWTGNDHVFGLFREHAGERLLLLGNFSPWPQAVLTAIAHERGLAAPGADDHLVLEPYRFAWLSASEVSP